MGSHWFATAVLIGSHFTDKSQWTNPQLCCMYFMTTGIITAIIDKPFVTLTVSFPWLSHQNIQWGTDFVMVRLLVLNGFTWCILAIWFHIIHDDVIKWKHFPCYWSFVQGIHRSPVNSPHKGQWCGALMFFFSCTWISTWVNNREAGDLRRHRAHYQFGTKPNLVAKILATKFGVFFVIYIMFSKNMFNMSLMIMW